MSDDSNTMIVFPASYGFKLERTNCGVCIAQQNPFSEESVIYLEDHELIALARACADEFGWKLEFDVGANG